MSTAINLAELESLAKSPGWQLIVTALTSEIAKTLIPAAVGTDLNAIGIAAVSRAAAYSTLRWVRDEMLAQMIAKERKAASE